jgi:hypothetical protein
MLSRESSLGAWADKLPPVDEPVGPKAWENVSVASTPATPEELASALKGIGTVLLIGIGLLIGSGVFLLFSLSSVAGRQTVEGVVIDLDERLSRQGTVYAPVVAYVVDQREYELEGSVASSWDIYDIGDAVSVAYHPDDPSDATVADFTQLYFFPTLLGGAGLVFTLGAVGLVAYVAKKSGWRLLPARR